MQKSFIKHKLSSIITYFLIVLLEKKAFFLVIFLFTPNLLQKFCFSRLFSKLLSPKCKDLIECSCITNSTFKVINFYCYFFCKSIWMKTYTCWQIKKLIDSGADPGLGQGGAPGPEAESCWHSEAESHERSEQFAAGVQGLLKGPGSFWVFNAQICILPHSRDSFSLIFDIYFNTKSW